MCLLPGTRTLGQGLPQEAQGTPEAQTTDLSLDIGGLGNSGPAFDHSGPPHAEEASIKQPPDRWLSNAHMTHYQAMLLDADRVQFGPVVALNPAALLPLPEKPEEHDYIQIIAEMHRTRPDLMDQPLQDVDHTWYTDGSSFLVNGERKAGAAMTTETEVIRGLNSSR